MAYKITKHRRGTTQEWLELDLVPAEGELVIEECDGGIRKCKIGDGILPFSKLSYVTDSLAKEIEVELDTLRKQTAEALDAAGVLFDKKISDTEAGFSTALSSLETDVSNHMISLGSNITNLSGKIDSISAIVQEGIQPDIDNLTAIYSQDIQRLQETTAQHTSDLSMLSSSIESKAEELTEAYEQKAAELTNAIAASETTLTADYTNRIEAVEDRLQDSISTINQTVQQHTEGLDSIQDSILELQTTTDDLSVEIDEKVSASEDLIKISLDDIRASITQINIALEQLQNQSSPDDGNSAPDMGPSNMGSAVLPSLIEQLDNLQYKVSLLESGAEFTAIDLVNINNELVRLAKSLTTLTDLQKTNFDALSNTLEVLDSKFSKADSDIINVIASNKAEISEDLANLAADYMLLYNLIYKIQDELIKKINSTKNDSQANLDTAISEVNRNIDNTKTALSADISKSQATLIETLNTAVASLTSDINKIKDLHSTKIDANTSAISALSTATKTDYTNLTGKLEELTVEVTDSKAKITNNRMAVLATNAELANKVSIINTELETLDKRLDTQAIRISELNHFDLNNFTLNNNEITKDDFANLVKEVTDIRNVYDTGDTIHSACDVVRAIGEDLTELRNSLPEYIPANAVDGLRYEDNQLYLTSGGNPVGEPVTITGGTGEGGSSYTLSLSAVGGTRRTVAKSNSIKLFATFYEKFDGTFTDIPGTLEVYYKLTGDKTGDWNFCLRRYNIEQNKEFYEDIAKIPQITELLNSGKTVEVQFKILGSRDEKSATITYYITQVDISIAQYPTEYNYDGVCPDNFIFQFKCKGNVQKTAFYKIDADEPISKEIGNSQTVEDFSISMADYDYGAHILKVYFETPEGARSNILSYALLYNDGTSTAPMIGVLPEQTEIDDGEPLKGSYIVAEPGKDKIDELTIQVYSYDKTGKRVVYDTRVEQNFTSNKKFDWPGLRYPASGDAFIDFTCGSTTETISIKINEVKSDYTLEPISTGLIYAYTAGGWSNTSADRAFYEYTYTTADGKQTTVETSFENFNWVSNGYTSSDQDALTLSGDALHTIKLPLFTTAYVDKDGQNIYLNEANKALTSTGRTFEVEFSVSNVTDINAPIIQCMPETGSKAGFVITPQACYLLSHSTNININNQTGFIENEASVAAAYLSDNTRIRVAFVIEPEGTIKYTHNGVETSGQCINIYVNGQFAKSLPYDSSNDTFNQTEFIKIGSDTCITKIYDIRIYNRGLLTEEVLQNYKASPMPGKLTRFEDNDILTSDGTDVDYYKAIKKYPCLLITGPLSTYIEQGDSKDVEASKAKSGVTLTKPDPNPDNELGYTVEFELLDKDLKGKWVSSNKIQGTTSKTYPIKNYKVYLAEVLRNEDGTPQTEVDEETKETKTKTKKVEYSLKGPGLSIGESTLCWKCDYMSTDHANTFNANIADTLFGNDTSSKQENPLVQNTIYGFRCLLFQRDDETNDSLIRFAGDGALNNDKSNVKTFGLKRAGDKDANTTCQKWEFNDNVEDICKFLSDRLFEPAKTDSGADTVKAYAALESTYPDQGDLEEKGLSPNYNYIQTLFTWVCQRANFWDASTNTLEPPKIYKGQEYNTERDYRKAIFISEFEKHFNKNHALVYYLFCEFTALCDNRAKNMFLRSEDVTCEQLYRVDGSKLNSIQDVVDLSTGEVDAEAIDWESSVFAKWIPDLYDLDSCFGVENTGKLEIPYYAEWDYTLGGKHKFNSYESRLWLMFEEAFKEVIKEEAVRLTKNTKLNYEDFYNYHIRDNALTMCPAVINRDMEYKYHDSWAEGYTDYTSSPPVFSHNNMYKYLQRGSRIDQKTAFMYRRFNMLYSKYLCDQFTNNQIKFRCGTKIGEEDCIVTLKANQVFYPAVKFGDGGIWLSEDKTLPNTDPTYKGVPISKTNGGIDGEDYIYIAGASFLTDIGDLSKFYPHTMTLDAATSLKKLIIGSAEPGYINDKLTSLTLSNCPLLEEINTFGCINLGTIDLSNNHLIQSVSTSTPVKLPNGGVLKTLRFDKNIASIEVLNQRSLETFNCPDTEDLDKLVKVWVENTPKIPALSIAIGRLNSRDSLASGLRLVGINENIDIKNLMKLTDSSLVLGKFLNEEGKLTDATRYPYIEGTVKVDSLTGEEYNLLKQCYSTLNIEYNTIKPKITFMDAPGTNAKIHEIQDLGEVAWGESGEGSTPAILPTKAPTEQYTYRLIGWTTDSNGIEAEEDALKNIIGDRILYPVFEAIINTFTVTFINPTLPEESQEIAKVTVDYGDSAVYPGDLDEVKNMGVESNIRDLYECYGWYPAPDYVTRSFSCEAQFALKDFNHANSGNDDGDTLPGYTLGLSDIDYTTSGTDIAITKCNNTFNEVIAIPSSLTDDGTNYTVKKICAESFIENSTVKIIIIPSSVTTIEEYSFAQCGNLASFEVAANENYEVLQKGKLLLDKNGKLIQGLSGSRLTKDLTKIKSLGAYCFSESNITTAYIPDDVKDIPEYAFSSCKELTTVTLPSNLTKLSATCFAWCDKLSDIVLPEGLQTIGVFAFRNCTQLSKIEVPATVTKILARALSGMTSLRTVIFKKDKQGNYTMPNIAHTKKLFDAADTLDDYDAFEKSGPLTFYVPWTEDEHTARYGKDYTFGAASGSTIVYYTDESELPKEEEVSNDV